MLSRSYYGDLGPIVNKNKSFVHFLLKENKTMWLKELKLMESRLREHMTECKRAIILELQKNKPKVIKLKEVKNESSKND